MASMNPNRKSYILSVEPVAYSLTAGTGIPAPPESPPMTPAEAIRPPTPGGGPLTSHPTTPDNVPTTNNFPPTPEPEKQQQSTSNARAYPNNFRTPMYPASATVHQASSINNGQPDQAPRRKGVHKLLSLSNLRSSFSSSRSSISLPRTSHDNQSQYPSPIIDSSNNYLKRPASPSMASTTASAWSESRPPLREQKSGSSWFRRKSGMFLNVNPADVQMLDAVHEDYRPETRESKRSKKSHPAPLLPEIGALGAGGFDDGKLGWDERQFGT